MAAVSTKVSSSLVVKVKTGVAENGDDIMKKFTVGSLVLDAQAQDILDVALGLNEVLQYPVSEIDKVDHSDVTNG
ncbi:DUF1659 domain-containing protein [Clostridium tyrobutyricum]|jgi:hypothetical protein|uniref:DUF1659 domain-containing protein n=1 Tax=Clostridium tyrobutyricum TaxID=1519 RepID=UPI0010AB3DAB|nr:DUF1659 domain-containing protein [Clostridium tyrobutyricum]MBR9648177.1 DUF1659 domain-containing protein [Clostridium tyrobutyricum]MEA5009144.1 DUF1659 domain-containing protein [Clostridium tyrobutyricum]QCH29469.1 hypothetical protein EZN00_03102 [Clostridium tyrobutyricum]